MSDRRFVDVTSEIVIPRPLSEVATFAADPNYDEFVPGERLVMRTDQGPFPMETMYTWEDAPAGGTLMTLRSRGRPSGFGRIGAKPMSAAMRRANQKDLERLRGVLER